MSEKENICIVTGVGPDKGTGAEIAKLFGKKNYKVAMIARNEENLKKLEKKYNNVFSYPCDVSDIEKFKTTLKK
ncbi:MAG: SDR family NAD(P)-dependent oxidoreductase, partial [Alphaproteobacteria bacterium]